VSWDGFQREVLGELGVSVYALAGEQARVDGPVETKPPSPLLLALLRAAAADMDHDDALALCRDFLDNHPNPSANERRKFWPELRRLRANSP